MYASAVATPRVRIDLSKKNADVSAFETSLLRRIINQDTAVAALVRTYQLTCGGIRRHDKPIANLLFAGPTGTGKTFAFETAAEILFGSPTALVKIDCTEFQHSHEIAKLIGCFVPGTQVLMADGSRKAIEDIRIGDYVITRFGRSRPVQDTYEYPSPPEMVKLQIASSNVPLICTPDHKIWAIKGPGPSRPTTKAGRDAANRYDTAKLEWLAASALEKNDIVIYPRLQASAEEHVIDLADFGNDHATFRCDAANVWFFGKKQVTPRYIPCDENFARLAGYYVSEGGNSTNRSAINFTFGVPHKQFALDDTKALLPSIFGDSYILREQDRSERHSMRLYYASTIVAEMFASLFGDHTHTKCLPEWFLRLPDNILWHFLDAAILGDGGRTVRRRVDYSTSSPKLYSQIELILRRLGITTQIQESEPPNPKWKRRYRIYISGDQITQFAGKLPFAGAGVDLTNPGNDGIQRMSHVDAQYIYFRIKSAVRIPSSGNVYDISVGEDTSFVANGIGVKNSPPGYLGHRETPAMLSQHLIDQYQTDKNKFTFVVFDEIEKANEALWQMLLGIMDKGIVSLGDGKTTRLQNCVIGMTTNLGATEMHKLSTGASSTIGLVRQTGDRSKIQSAARTAVEGNFSPEFLNRLDETVVFNSLSAKNMHDIVSLELSAVQSLISITKGTPVFFILRWTNDVLQVLLSKAEKTESYGARPLKRVIERDVIIPLSIAVSTWQIPEASTVLISVDNGEIVFDVLSPRI